MWAEMLHLVFGNALIGIGEGWLLSRLFSLQKSPCVTTMILANYVSAWLGGAILVQGIANNLALDLYNAWNWLWILAAVSYVLTIFVEWPFIWWRMRRLPNPLWRSLGTSWILQSCSYLILFGWYWLASGTSLYSNMQIVQSSELTLPATVHVYYISASDGSMARRRLAGGDTITIPGVLSTNDDDRLIARPSSNADKWDVVARLSADRHSKPAWRTVSQAVPLLAAPTAEHLHLIENEEPGNWFNFGPAQQLGVPAKSPWTFRAGFWPIEGLVAKNTETSVTIHFSFETPFAAWNVRNVVQLPTDHVLFQLGRDQICIFEPSTRRVAMLWRGRGPLPVIDTNRFN